MKEYDKQERDYSHAVSRETWITKRVRPGLYKVVIYDPVEIAEKLHSESSFNG